MSIKEKMKIHPSADVKSTNIGFDTVIWHDLMEFSSGSTCMILASLKYDENDYMRVYKDSLNLKNI